MNRPCRSPLAIALLLLSVALLQSACTEQVARDTETRSRPDAGDVVEDAPTHEPDGSDAADTAPSNDTGPDDRSDADASATEDAAPTAASLAEGIAITDIQAFQTVETRLLEDGAAAESDVPLVAGRETLFRILVSPEDGWTPRELTAELVLADASTGESQELTDTMTVAQASASGERDSAFEIRVPGASLTAETSASFRLLGDDEADGAISVDDTTPTQARWPQDGSTMPLAASEATGTLPIVIVPIRYDSDGSGRMPDTSPAQLALFENALRALYPAQAIDLQVREPIVWTGWMRFGSINRELRSLKQADGAEHAYYYGVIQPAESIEAHCSGWGSCTTGQSFTVDSAESTSYRVGSGLGFSGERWAWTLVHEIGHMHGRGHASCGVSSWSQDSSYPYSDGLVGVWGWDSRNDIIFGPQEATDFMGYCDDLWSSDYTYLGLFERMSEANSLQQTLSLRPESTWRYINWSDDHAPSWGRSTQERDPSTGHWASASFLDAAAEVLQQVQIPLIRYAHDGERSVLVPEAPQGATSIQIDAAAKSFELPLP